MKRNIWLVLISLLLWAGGSALVTNAQSDSINIEEVSGDNISGPQTWSRIRIPDASVEVNLLTGGKYNDKWLVSRNKALYWIQGQTTVVYGHNTKDIFGKLKNINAGAQVEMAGQSGELKNYKVYSLEEVGPSDVRVLDDSEAELILITCTGWRDEKRLVIKAEKQS